MRVAFALAALLLAAPAAAQEDVRIVNVVELFTSQGCAACPAADKLIGEMAQRQDTMVLTFAVDYWDYLGWKDTLGSPAYSSRQRAYARVRGDRQVFTPQVVINGVQQAVGSDPAAIAKAVEDSRNRDDLLSVPVSVREVDGQIEVTVAEERLAGAGEVWVVALARERTVAIERGENAKRSVTYSNVVRRMTRLGSWAGKPANFRAPRQEAVPSDADFYVVLVQGGSGSAPSIVLGIARGPRA